MNLVFVQTDTGAYELCSEWCEAFVLDTDDLTDHEHGILNAHEFAGGHSPESQEVLVRVAVSVSDLWNAYKREQSRQGVDA